MSQQTIAWFGTGPGNVNQPTFVVPDGVTTLDVTIGGASGGSTQVTGHPAGWGPLFTGTLFVTPGETLYMQVGSLGGGEGSGSGTGTGRGRAGWPDGGLGGQGPQFNKGGGGAGSSRIWRDGIGGNLAVLVAGGGGIGFSLFHSDPNPGIGCGLAPPGEPTINGPTNGDGYSPVFANHGGLHGTISAGGAHGIGGGTPTDGSFMQGGDASPGTGITNSLTPSGAGGGGGYYGGGAGAHGQGGGGGMSYIDKFLNGWVNTLWDLTPPLSVSSSLPFRNGSIRFTYQLPDHGGWSLGLVKRLG
jgi:hypothetical protein